MEQLLRTKTPRRAPIFGRCARLFHRWEGAPGQAHKESVMPDGSRVTVKQNASIFDKDEVVKARKCGNNTAEVHTANGERHIVYRKVPIITYQVDGEVIARHNGFTMYTTARRLEAHLGLAIWQHYHRWYVFENYGWWRLEDHGRMPERMIWWRAEAPAIYLSDYFERFARKVTPMQPNLEDPQKPNRSLILCK